MQNRQDIGTLIKVAGGVGIFTLLMTMVQAFLSYHSHVTSLVP